MLQRRKRLIRAAVLLFLIVNSALSRPKRVLSQAQSGDTNAVQIHIFNRAAIRRADLLKIGLELTRIYAAAGIRLEVTEASLDSRPQAVDFSPMDAGGHACKTGRQSRAVAVDLIPHAPPRFLPDAVGFSLPCAAFGIDSTIFLDRCEQVFYRTPVTLNRLLAYAIAHELGHILLRSGEHSASGLMRSTWDSVTWRSVACGALSFDPDQAMRIRDEINTFVLSPVSGRPTR